MKTSHSIVTDSASAFLLAGTQAVIASAADVDDAASPAMMARIHSFLAQGRDAAEAVRLTALEERKLAGGDPPSVRLMVIGGSANLVVSAMTSDPNRS